MSNPKCCDLPTKIIFIWDSPSSGYGYNLYGCDCCGSIIKDDKRTDRGITKIDVRNEVTKIAS